MKNLVLVFSVIALFILSGQSLYACSCGIPEPSEVESFSETDFSNFVKPFDTIFIGRIMKKEMRYGHIGERKKSESVWRITFEVEKYWRGNNDKRITIYTQVFCGFPYKVGDEYLVPAWTIKGRLEVWWCVQGAFTNSQNIIIRRLGTPTKTF